MALLALDPKTKKMVKMEATQNCPKNTKIHQNRLVRSGSYLAII